MDIKPRPQTELGQWEAWMNRMSAIFVQLNGKRVKVMFQSSEDSAIVFNWKVLEKQALDNYIKIVMRDI